MRIEPYDPSHLQAIVELSLRAWAPVFNALEQAMEPQVYRHFYPDWRSAQRKAVEAACTSDDTRCWVAANDDDIVTGFVVVKLDQASSMGEIHMLAVDPARQRQGVGSALTARATDWMKEAGMAVAMVETGGDPGHTPARQTYERMGFRPLSIVRYFKKL